MLLRLFFANVWLAGNPLLGWFRPLSWQSEIHAHRIYPRHSRFLSNARPRLADPLLGSRGQVGLCGAAVWILDHAAILL
jgi:hypothetical protein